MRRPVTVTIARNADSQLKLTRLLAADVVSAPDYRNGTQWLACFDALQAAGATIEEACDNLRDLIAAQLTDRLSDVR